MACYSPLAAEYRKDYNGNKLVSSNGKNLVHILGKFNGDSEWSYDLIRSGDIFTIPCGKCIGCRLDYSRHWADRMMLEYEACKKAVFVTLTYEDSNLHYYVNDDGEAIPELSKKDCSEFIKCLRSKFVDNGRDDITVRFFACGEYGEKFHRPHMHIILFGVDLNDLQNIVFSGDIRGDLEPWTCNELGQISYRSNLLEDTWKERGIVSVSDVSYETMAYVGRYSLKKAKGDYYAKDTGVNPEFTLMSRMPGIGKPFLDKMKEERPKLFEEVSTWYVGPGKDIFWPKYLLEKYYSEEYYGDGFEKKLDEIKLARKTIAVNNFLNTYENDERPYYQKQDFLNKQKESAIKKLVRGDAVMV